MTTPVRVRQSIRQLETKGLTHTQIARELGVSRTTVVKYATCDYSPVPPTGGTVDWLQCIRQSDEGRMTWDWRPTMAGPKHPRHYEESFKRQIVQLYENGKPARGIKDEYDISHSTPHRWVRGIRNSGSTKAADNRTPEQNEPVEPRKRNRQLEMEVDVSEQAAPAFARSRRDTGQRLRCPISAQCRILGVPRSTCHSIRSNDPSRAGGPDRRRRARGPARQPRTLRRRKIKAALERRGVTASRRRIGNIMREQGMTSTYARRRFKPHGTRADEAKLANLLDREFEGYAPHTHLASDLTYVRVGNGWAYVCLLAGLADRGIAGHSVGRTRDAGLVLGAFATLDFPPADVQVFHTDRGSEFDCFCSIGS